MIFEEKISLENELKDKVLVALAELGSTPDAIAASLLKLGHFGERRCQECPVNDYLSARFPEWYFYVSYDGIDARRRLASGEIFDAVCATPRPVARFLDRFDYRGEYPELLSDEAPQEEETVHE